MTELPARTFRARDGVRLAYRALGSGRPLVLIHGYFSTATLNWVRYGRAAPGRDRGDGPGGPPCRRARGLLADRRRRPRALRRVPGGHMSAVARPELGAAIAEFLTASPGRRA